MKRKPYELERKSYTALEAVIEAIDGAGLGRPKRDGSELLSKFSKKGSNASSCINAIEFLCSWEFTFGNEFSDALGDTVASFFYDDKVTVKDFSEMIHRAFCEDNPNKKRFTFVDGGTHCTHYEKREDLECLTGIQDCYSCKYWDNSHLDGEFHDCTIGECTWQWRDPNGERQMTFPFDSESQFNGKRIAL